MTAVTRLESLLSLLTSPQGKTQLAQQSEEIAEHIPAPFHPAVSSPLRGHSAWQHSGPSVATCCAGPEEAIKRASSPPGNHSQPHTEQDVNAAAHPDTPGRDTCASDERAATGGTQQPAHVLTAEAGSTGCMKLVTTSTPRPRQPDARAVPMAKHPARAVWRPQHCRSGGSGRHEHCHHSDECAAADTASPGERCRWEQRIGAALRRAQVLACDAGRTTASPGQGVPRPACEFPMSLIATSRAGMLMCFW